MDLVFLVRCKKGSMECRMDLPCFGEAELIRDQGKEFNYCEGSFTFWSEFWIGDGAFQVPGF